MLHLVHSLVSEEVSFGEFEDYSVWLVDSMLPELTVAI